MNEAPVIAAAAATTNALACSVGFRDFAGPGPGRRAGFASGARSRRASARGCSGCDGASGRGSSRLPDCSARRLLGQQAEQFDGIEPRRRGRQWSGAENAKQLRKAAALVLGQDMKDDKGEDHPGPDPMQHRHVVTGVEAEIEQASANQQHHHRYKENPVHQRDQRAQPGLPAAEQPAQANLVQLNTAHEAGADQVDDVTQSYRDQDDGRLHVQGPYARARQHHVQQVDPGSVGRFRRDPQPADERNSERPDEQPVQDDGSIVCLTLPHAYAPLLPLPEAATNGRCLLPYKARLQRPSSSQLPASPRTPAGTLEVAPRRYSQMT